MVPSVRSRLATTSDKTSHTQMPDELSRARTCVLVLCGLPGAGKSTLAAALASHPPCLSAASPVLVSCVSFDQVGVTSRRLLPRSSRSPTALHAPLRPALIPHEHAACDRWSESMRRDTTGRELRRKRPRSIRSCGRYDTRHLLSKPLQSLRQHRMPHDETLPP
jgi:hypothetical protein